MDGANFTMRKREKEDFHDRQSFKCDHGAITEIFQFVYIILPLPLDDDVMIRGKRLALSCK